MKKKLLSLAMLGALSALSGNVLAEEAAAPAAAEPASPHTFSYNLGLFSQYIWRGMTQTDEELALQGGIDYAHSSGFYAGAWASNVSWTTDTPASMPAYEPFMDSGSLELDLYAGYAGTFGKSDFGYNVGLLQYVYPGTTNSNYVGTKEAPNTNATELYGALSYKWANVKASYTLSDEAWGFDNADGTWYIEANADIPIGESGYTINLHVGDFQFDGKSFGVDNDNYDYTDWKVGVTKAWSNGVKLGAYYTDNNADHSFWLLKEQTDGQFTVFVQKIF